MSQPPSASTTPYKIGTVVYITDKFEPEYMQKGVITGYIRSDIDVAYWVRVRSAVGDVEYENIFFHHEIQPVNLDLTPATVSGEALIHMAVNGLLEPMVDPLGAMGGCG